MEEHFGNELVSIIIAAYNAERWLKDTLTSVVAQSWKQIEIIVVDDGSTDNTYLIASAFIAHGVKVLRQDNKGQDAAFNYGYSVCNGHYIKFMDADDLINDRMIEIQMRYLSGKAGSIAYGEWARFFNDEPAKADFKKLEYWNDNDAVSFLTARPAGVMLQCGITLIPRPLIEKEGLWDERLSIFNDTEFYTRMMLGSDGIIFTPGARLYYRSGISQSITSQRSEKSFRSSLLAIQLIGNRMIAFENSRRVKNLIANMSFFRYSEMYPDFPSLQAQYLQLERAYGGASASPSAGKVYSIISAFIGWKATKRLKKLLSGFGYTALKK